MSEPTSTDTAPLAQAPDTAPAAPSVAQQGSDLIASLVTWAEKTKAEVEDYIGDALHKALSDLASHTEAHKTTIANTPPQGTPVVDNVAL